MARPYTYDHAAMRVYRRSGHTIRGVAEHFGCSTQTASEVCRGVVPVIDLHKAARLKNLAKALDKGNARVRGARARAAQAGEAYQSKSQRRQTKVPPWAAKAGLSGDYLDLSATFDEHHAARECRRLKAEAQRPCL